MTGVCSLFLIQRGDGEGGGRWGLLRVMCELHSLGCLPVAHSVTDLGLVWVTKMKRLCSSLDLLPGLLETQVIHSGVFCKLFAASVTRTALLDMEFAQEFSSGPDSVPLTRAIRTM